jgi:hypothetical protein
LCLPHCILGDCSLKNAQHPRVRRVQHTSTLHAIQRDRANAHNKSVANQPSQNGIAVLEMGRCKDQKRGQVERTVIRDGFVLARPANRFEKIAANALGPCSVRLEMPACITKDRLLHATKALVAGEAAFAGPAISEKAWVATALVPPVDLGGTEGAGVHVVASNAVVPVRAGPAVFAVGATESGLASARVRNRGGWDRIRRARLRRSLATHTFAARGTSRTGSVVGASEARVAHTCRPIRVRFSVFGAGDSDSLRTAETDLVVIALDRRLLCIVIFGLHEPRLENAGCVVVVGRFAVRARVRLEIATWAEIVGSALLAGPDVVRPSVALRADALRAVRNKLSPLNALALAGSEAVVVFRADFARPGLVRSRSASLTGTNIHESDHVVRVNT